MRGFTIFRPKTTDQKTIYPGPWVFPLLFLSGRRKTEKSSSNKCQQLKSRKEAGTQKKSANDARTKRGSLIQKAMGVRADTAENRPSKMSGADLPELLSKKVREKIYMQGSKDINYPETEHSAKRQRQVGTKISLQIQTN
jgi:hypothetical protein